MATIVKTTVTKITTGKQFVRILLAVALFASSLVPLVLLAFSDFDKNLTGDIWIASLGPVCGLFMVAVAIIEAKKPTESVWIVGRYLSCTVLLVSSIYFFLVWSSNCADSTENCFSDTTLNKIRLFSAVLLLGISIIIGSVQ